ncbi:DNA-(apurinic or apyrimidinic site) lyase 2-like [Lingula anatina]|uniref:DNA-(apurinic or apyrimidinic site) endonuclease n=1 Tax=Lingula anatina TaxID=7574 RepID=A0A1S3K520_LINAN|nr:DNA-(apurinic or apyrimidinic site) lyase 2-like [Lingula anatina]|eukprot:XP_013417725.1 DNA-(apurinic or apyrimidinic site) lyase 2-like [Lingula anatina]
MKIITWNINGIRATKSPLKKVIDDLDADIVCFQETKVTRDQLDEPTAIVEGYSSYYSFSKVRSGYSGVATYCKTHATPLKAEEGLTGLLATTGDESALIGCYGNHADFTDEELQSLDNEGRVIITQHKIRAAEGREELLTIINVYVPRADPEREDRQVFKQRFCQLLQTRAEALVHAGSHVIILGDLNISHRQIDHCDPVEKEEFDARPSRKWLSAFLKPIGTAAEPAQDVEADTDSIVTGGIFLDTFRYFRPNEENAFTCWNTSTGARQTNYGTRIDYILASADLCEGLVKDCVIWPDIEGSDHCPVKAELTCNIVQSAKYPPICTKFMPEFSGKQQKLSEFFSKSVKEPKHTSVELVKSEATIFKEEFCEKDESVTDARTITEVKHKTETRLLSKRAAPLLMKQTSKKSKMHDRKGKQSSLMNFFVSKTITPAKEKGSLDSGIENRTCVEDGIFLSQNSDGEGTYSSQESNETSSVTYSESISLHSSQESNETPSSQETINKSQNLKDAWKTMLKGPPKPPSCKGHKEPCVLRTVKKEGVNFGRQFWCCARPQGHASNPLARCEHFEWLPKKKKGSLK